MSPKRNITPKKPLQDPESGEAVIRKRDNKRMAKGIAYNELIEIVADLC